MEPQMIRVTGSILPTSRLHSDKIHISGDSSIFEIQHELPHDGGKFRSRYEIYNSSTKPFTQTYREVTLTSSASSLSSTLSESTTYITCSSEIEPVQVNGFQCIDEKSRRHTVTILNEDRYDHIHEATNYEITPPTPKIHSHNNADKNQIAADEDNFPKFYTPQCNLSSSSCSEDEPEHITRQHLINIETWSNGPKEQPLKSPLLLKQLISDIEAVQQLPTESPTKNANSQEKEEEEDKPVTRCKSFLNLDLQHQDSQSVPQTPEDEEVQTRKKEEKERITKTISIMLEKRQKDLASQAQVTTNKPQPHNPVFNEKLINENIELIERPHAHTLDRSCRVTGELLKDKIIPSDYQRTACTLPRTLKSHRSQLQRHFYYPLHATKSSSRVLDAELPDPDKVKHARELFERVLKTTSLENVSCARQTAKKDTWTRPTPEIRQPLENVVMHPKLHKCFSADAYQPNTKWFDSGSISSGVGSDISVETDAELNARSGSETAIKEDAIFSSEEDLSKGRDCQDMGKPITEEILRNIRCYGTSVTYFGGKVIDRSEGFSCSPMTMTIMNEIKQSSPDYRANRKFLFNDRLLAKFKMAKSTHCTQQVIKITEKNDEDKTNITLHEDCNNNEVRRETSTIKEEEEEEMGKKLEKADTKLMNETNNKKNEYQKPVNDGNQKWIKDSKSFCDMEFEEFEVLDDTLLT